MRSSGISVGIQASHFYFRTDPPPDREYAIDLSILLSNRGACYLRRLWEGDAYASLMDMIRALKIEPRNTKLYYRIVKALVELKQYDSARKIIQSFKVFLRFFLYFDGSLV